jgi:hypothetical protein
MTSPAVLLIIFNRAEKTRRIFEQVRTAQPAKLYVFGDGARSGNAEDEKLITMTRTIATAVDWPCELVTNFQSSNLGATAGPITAITWFFSNVEEGIILEDDCLPHPSFFPFCATLLERYRHDVRIVHIGGSNLQFGRHRGEPAKSYYFSRISSVWGWASWRRVWENYDANMTGYPAFESSNLMRQVFPDPEVADWASMMSRMVYEKKLLTWDYPLAFQNLIRNGLSITPNKNLVSNIGFGAGGSRTTNAEDVHANIPTEDIGTIQHPQFFVADTEADMAQLRLSMPPKAAAPERKRWTQLFK